MNPLLLILLNPLLLVLLAQLPVELLAAYAAVGTALFTSYVAVINRA